MNILSHLLKQTDLNEEQKEYTDTICRSGDALLNVINDVLDFSKPESGDLEKDAHDFNLRSCVEEALDLFSCHAKSFGIDLLYQLDDDIETGPGTFCRKSNSFANRGKEI